MRDRGRLSGRRFAPQGACPECRSSGVRVQPLTEGPLEQLGLAQAAAQLLGCPRGGSGPQGVEQLTHLVQDEVQRLRLLDDEQPVDGGIGVEPEAAGGGRRASVGSASALRPAG